MPHTPSSPPLRNFSAAAEGSRGADPQGTHPDPDGGPESVEWTAQTLRDTIAEHLPNNDLIVVSNREPYLHEETDDGLRLRKPVGGLVSALEPVARSCSGTWIAHGSGSGDRRAVDADDRLQVPPDDPSYTLRRVWLTEEEEEGYYIGFANEGLWPLCHTAFVCPVFRPEDWEHYVAVNARFADAVVEEARTGAPMVIIQDYHFALLPRMVRDRLPDATIVTFWHIPWPHSEVFRICPYAGEILHGLLGSSVLGFHVPHYRSNFAECVERTLEARVDWEEFSVQHGGATSHLRAYPISIEWPGPAADSHPAETLRREHGFGAEVRTAVGVERLDYTKGIPERLQAVDTFLARYPEWRGRFSLLQVAAPSRDRIGSYRRLRERCEALAEEINARHTKDGVRPIHLSIRNRDQGELQPYYRGGDICIVSSLHDGMNLVSKEFVASRDREDGVLILSSFAGSARELPEALSINPFDRGGMAEALRQALEMPIEEQRDRMQRMRRTVAAHNVYRWAGTMLLDAIWLGQRDDYAAAPESAEPEWEGGAPPTS